MRPGESRRRSIRHQGPTEQEYRRVHPEVDWSTHEILTRVVNAGRTGRDGVIVLEICGHRLRDPRVEELLARRCPPPAGDWLP